MNDELVDTFRREAGRCTASLIRVLGDIDLAEDAVAEAFAVAAEQWPVTGVPANPGGWITTTARNRAVDRLRRESTRDARQLAAHALHVPDVDPSGEALWREIDGLADALPDDRLRLLFLCCHPALHTASAGDSLARVDLCAEGIRLGRVLATLMPDEPEVSGLVALMLLTDARRAARTSADGSFVALADQDRSRWDRTMIAEGHEIVRACIRRDRPGRYQLMAAIAAVHDAAATFEATDWAQILTVYDHLYSLRPDPVVRLNRAVAVAELHGPVVGLDELDELAGVLDGYQPFHATRAELLLRLGDPAAAAAFDRAIALTTNEVERRHLERRRAAC